MKTRSRGAYELEIRGPHLREIAGDVGVGKTTAGYWITGERRPSEDHVARLSELYGVPPEAWDEPWPPATDDDPSTRPAGFQLDPSSPLPGWLQRLCREGITGIDHDDDERDRTACVIASTLKEHPELIAVALEGPLAKHPAVIADILEALRPYAGEAPGGDGDGTGLDGGRA